MIKKLSPENVGIYKLTCMINNKFYIGKSTNLLKRINNHKNVEKRPAQKHYLQHAIKKHGWESFTVEILETFKDFDKNNNEHNKLILEREAYYISLYDTTNRDIGYNICEYSNDTTGRVLSDEHKEKIRAACNGRIFSEQHKKNISLHRKGSKASEEAKMKMSASRRGKSISEEARKNRFGKKRSKETVEKIRLAALGRKHSDETKEQMRLAALGRKHSEETKEKMSKSQTGRTHSEETKEKMRISFSKIKKLNNLTIIE